LFAVPIPIPKLMFVLNKLHGLSLVAALCCAACLAPSNSRVRFFGSCSASSECESSLCYEGTCTVSCGDDSVCGDHGVCKQAHCAPRDACAADVGCADAASPTDAVSEVVACSEKPCRAIPPQCGCPANQGCYLPTGTPVCLAAGAAVPGDVCANDNDCSAGSVCITGQALGNFCALLCKQGDNSACSSGVCIETGLVGTGACMVACDPVNQTGCGARNCYLLPNAKGGYVSQCGKIGGKAGAGAACVGMVDCAPGLTCAAKVCRPWCNRASPSTCAGNCSAGVPAVKVGSSEFGVCLP